MRPCGFGVPHLLTSPAIYVGNAPSRLRARFCPDCTASQYAVRGRGLGETSHYCPGAERPVLVHWFAAG